MIPQLSSQQPSPGPRRLRSLPLPFSSHIYTQNTLSFPLPLTADDGPVQSRHTPDRPQGEMILQKRSSSKGELYSSTSCWRCYCLHFGSVMYTLARFTFNLNQVNAIPPAHKQSTRHAPLDGRALPRAPCFMYFPSSSPMLNIYGASLSMLAVLVLFPIFARDVRVSKRERGHTTRVLHETSYRKSCMARTSVMTVPAQTDTYWYTATRRIYTWSEN